MKILEIYEKYKIMPSLQLHMLRVAGVASIICDNFEKPVNKELIVSACLLHDMGNIIKSDLTKFAEFLQPEGLEYWQKIKNEFEEKYGKDEKNATHTIVEKLKISTQIQEVIRNSGFSKLEKVYNSSRFEYKICEYSDLRVLPYGVGSLKSRMTDLKIRYAKRAKDEMWNNHDYLADFIYKIEKQIFEHCKIRPEDITGKKVKTLADALRQYNILTKN